MRDHPLVINRVAAETTTNLVVHATQCHLLQAEYEHMSSIPVFHVYVPALVPVTQQVFKVGGMRKLGSFAKATQIAVE